LGSKWILRQIPPAPNQTAEQTRAGFNRFLQQRHPGAEDMEVRNAIHEIVLEHRRRYGYRRVAVELRDRGMAVNHKRVLQLMREDNLLAVEPESFVTTMESDHDLGIDRNLASCSAICHRADK
jgi:hypothetical protein